MDPYFPSRGYQRLADLYGEIFQADLGRRILYVSSSKLVNEVCDETRFHNDFQQVLPRWAV